jgi:hypothetical protein
VQEIRTALQQGHVLGTDRFKDAIETTLARRGPARESGQAAHIRSPQDAPRRLAGHRVRVTMLDPDAAPTAQIEAQCTALAARWRAETAWTSPVSQMVMHPAYQTIIGMGREVIPCLPRALEYQPEHWFWALRAMTGEDPGRPEDRGNVAAIAQSWLQWGQQHGYHW